MKRWLRVRSIKSLMKNRVYVIEVQEGRGQWRKCRGHYTNKADATNSAKSLTEVYEATRVRRMILQDPLDDGLVWES